MTIKAVFQDGVFRPLKPVTLQEGTEVDVTTKPERPIPTPEEVIESMMAIINLPQPDNGKKFNADDHDKILYGEPY